MSENIKEFGGELIERLERAERTVALTGAGVSVASGIPDFRSPGGIYSKVSQRTFELDFLYRQPEAYYAIAREYIHPLADKEPNATHKMLAELERRGLLEAIITQNIDSLHQKAGSKKVIEFHGNVNSFHCVRCNKPYERAEVEEKIENQRVPRCPCGGLIRPGIVFFSDPIPLRALEESSKLSRGCDVFIAMGSSLTVQPAASLPVFANHGSAEVYIVNREPTRLDSLATVCLHENVEAFSQQVMELLS